MKLTHQTALEFGIPQTANLLNLGFSDYFVPAHFELTQFHALLRANQIDVCLSKVAMLNGKAVGVGAIARRGWTSRLAAMSIIPEMRGKKVGLWLMEQLIDEAKHRGDRFMTLEVIRENERAIKLYEKVGFKSIRRLSSYKLESPVGAAGDLEEIDIRSLSNLINTNGYPNLPWQVSGENLAAMGPPARAYRMESAYAVITDPQADQIVFRSILTLPQARRQGQAASLLKALFALYPEKTWAIPAIFPEEMEPLFIKVGFVKEPLGQYQMLMELD